MKDKLAIFDMDGTLFDTAEANYEAYKNAVEKVAGKCTIGWNAFKEECFGKNYKIFLKDVFGLSNALIENVHEAKCSCYMKYVRKYVVENKFLFDVIGSIKDRYYIALLTTASTLNTYELLDEFVRTGLFDLIITGEDVKKLKPNVEGIEKAMLYFNVDSQNTVLFDDSEECINAAKHMGIDGYKVIMGR